MGHKIKATASIKLTNLDYPRFLSATFVCETLQFASMKSPSGLFMILIGLRVAGGHTQSSLRAQIQQPPEASQPYLVPLRRESVPVLRQGKIVSFKNSYSGVISVGSIKRQEFRVVFDTGSGHVVLPAIECGSETCLRHRRYNMDASPSARMVNMDGSVLAAGEYADQATIGFGTGKITGEFVKDRVCLGPAASNEADAAEGVQATAPCLDMALISALEMSAQPFKAVAFDGILGLGLGALSISPAFSFLDVLSKSSGTGSRHFGVYLTEPEEDGEESEVAIGGYNSKRLLEPLVWSPVANPDLGHWLVQILAVRINGKTLDVCEDGTCRGVVDTGSSHLGVPAPYHREFAGSLTQEVLDIADCRLIDAPTIEFQLAGGTVTVHPETYMRRLPLEKSIKVESTKGVAVEAKQAAGEHAAGDRLFAPTANNTNGSVGDKADAAIAPLQTIASGSRGQEPSLSQQAKRLCRPKMMPVNMAAPLGPKLFILGEPVLHRYYTVYDWATPSIGFGLAASRRNLQGPGSFSV